MSMSEIELFAMLGEDEFGVGGIGLKQAYAQAGVIPMVAVERGKVEQFWEQYETQAAKYGKRIHLVRFSFAEVLRSTKAGE